MNDKSDFTVLVQLLLVHVLGVSTLLGLIQMEAAQGGRTCGFLPPASCPGSSSWRHHSSDRSARRTTAQSGKVCFTGQCSHGGAF